MKTYLRLNCWKRLTANVYINSLVYAAIDDFRISLPHKFRKSRKEKE